MTDNPQTPECAEDPLALRVQTAISLNANCHGPQGVYQVRDAVMAEVDRDTATVEELAHALDNSTPYPIELDSRVYRFMAERLLEMLRVAKRPEHLVWQPEETPEPTQPQPSATA